MKKIPGYENYSITEDGQVWSHLRNKFIVSYVRRGPNYKYPYLCVSIRKEPNKFSLKNIHLLVLETYVGPRKFGMEGAHIDGNSLNNNVSNLKWCSKSENQRHRIIHGTDLRGSKHPKSKLTEDKVREIKNLLKTESHKKIANIFGISRSSVTAINNGRLWGHLA